MAVSNVSKSDKSNKSKEEILFDSDTYLLMHCCILLNVLNIDSFANISNIVSCTLVLNSFMDILKLIA